MMKRITSALLMTACAYLIVPAAPSAAQHPTAKTIEIGVFGQYTRFRFEGESACPCEWPSNGFGFGGRAAVFLNGGFFLEADAATTSTERILAPGNVRYTNAAVRINYGHPLAGGPDDGLTAILGVGPSYARYDSFENSSRWGGSGIVGLRWGLTEHLGLRFDGVADYTPEGRNFNTGLRAGVSIRFPRHSERPAPAARPTPPAAPEPRTDTVVVTQPAPQAPLRTADGSIITAPVFFDFDQSELRPDARSALELKLPWLRANPDLHLRVQGHADERGTSEYNGSLGLRRAQAVRSFLLERGVTAGALEIESVGDAQPACTAQPASEDCHHRNRRVNFIILSNHPDGFLVPERERQR